MPPLTSSFVEDIQSAFMAELQRAMGVGDAEDYPTPAYLQIKSIVRANPTQPSHVAESETPMIPVTYYGRIPTAAFLGGGGVRRDSWVFFIVAAFNADTVEAVIPITDEAEFRQIVHASADALLERMSDTLEYYNLSVYDTTHNWTVSSHGVNRVNAYFNYISEFSVVMYGYVEVIVDSERG